MGKKLCFTDKIVNSPVLLRQHLNRLQSFQGTSRTIETLRTEVRILGSTTPVVPPSTIISTGGMLGYFKSVTGSAEATFDIADVGTSAYIVDGFNLTAAGDKALIVPKVPPLVDSRTATQFKVLHYETGTLYVWLVRIDGVLGFSQAVVPGTVPISFTARANTNYLVDGYVLLADGNRGIIRPRIPPLADTRTTTGVDVEVFDSGTLYLWLTPY